MILIGISGPLKSGKDTVFEILSRRQTELKRMAFADPLKKEVAEACGVTVDFINEHKDVFRPMLQWWGTDFRRNLHGKLYWIKQAQLNLDSVKCRGFTGVVFTDVRFPNEYEFIKQNGGEVWRISRDVGDHAHRQHDSESMRFPYDRLIENNTSLDALEESVVAAFNETKRHEQIRTSQTPQS
jgi:hypothetical protein